MASDDDAKNGTNGDEPLGGASTGTAPEFFDERPLRYELFSAEQRRERGHFTAHEHQLGKDRGVTDRLLRRLEDNADVLQSVHRVLVDDVTTKKPVTPVGEWLVDNYYVIEEQISLARRHLPKKYLRELPPLANPGRQGIPRVYDMAERIIAYGDGRVDIADVSIILTAYQEVAPLRLGELWAAPIMLRLALIENIRRMAAITARARKDREIARKWADELIRVDENDPRNLVLTIADMVRAGPELTHSFVAEFKRKVVGRGGGMKMPMQWVEQSLHEGGRSVEQCVNEENHRQAVLEISMRNCINSLRTLNQIDWSEFVETMSVVEKTLRHDPADVYGKMDFATRDNYRRAVESMSRKSALGEGEVAVKCLELARAAASRAGAEPEEAHVGYYLIGDGERAMKESIGFRGGWGDFVHSVSPRIVFTNYLGSILALTALFTVVTAAIARANGAGGWMLAALTALLAIATCHLAVGLVNFAATLVVKPRSMPRMNYIKGIPAEQRTLVAVPLLIGSNKHVDSALRNLETHYLNNRGENIHFGLLTDFCDAPAETMPGDDELLARCRKGVEKLNHRYHDDGGDNFLLFHRPRKWNEVEKTWMGHERKRGKLEDLNRFLMGKGGDAFSLIEGKTGTLTNVKYVITLDADTLMARDSAWQQVGTMAHPLVQPRYDERLGRVVKGHGILQPRVDSRLSGANRSLYARMSATEIGIDPYTQASSDVYQDLFDEGSFIGKGIYEVETFDRALGGRFPDNKILSHDLIEGCVIRSGLLNDVKLYEDPPATYLMDIARRHRWVRGDWQIASYLWSRETRKGFKATTNPLNLLSQWKVFDNLRRSVTAIVLFLLLVLGLTVFNNPGLYMAVVVCVFIIPVLINSLTGLVRKNPDKTLGQHFSTLIGSTSRQALQALFRFACLPFEAYVNADAIVRSLWRQCVSHRRLLQWNPSDNSYKADLVHFRPVLRRMWIGPAAAVIMTAVQIWKNPDILLYAAPLFVLWLGSPWLVSRFSHARKVRKETLSDGQAAFLRKNARRIWLFFEEFVRADENWLPPDNYQEYPAGKIAHRTSPTNMGLSLLANLSAYDFGFATQGNLLYRSERALDTMLRMDRFRGHFYNWYDTLTLSVLRPAYISTVDSGNLAAHLMVLAAGLRRLSGEKIFGAQLFAGMRDTLELAVEEAENPGSPAILSLDLVRRELAGVMASPPAALSELWTRLESVASAAERVSEEWERTHSEGEERTRSWLAAFADQCRDAREELAFMAPWSGHMAGRNDLADFPELDRIPTLNELTSFRDVLAQNGREPPIDMQMHLDAAAKNAAERLVRIQKLLLECEDLSNVELDFLYDVPKRLLSIGYNVDDRRLDNSYYDLLASEARLAAYLGVAQRKLPQSSWFALGRMLTVAGGHPLLVSWSGSMFEYLMPLLVMPTYEDTLLDETCRACVSAQIEYGEAKGVPWGISESGYNVFDSEQNYQYRAFGVPELGLKHGLSEDLVVAPYATVLAAMVYPDRAARNLERLAADGCLTSFGFYEAVDYTPTRVPHGVGRAIVRSFMAHHQGMSLVALGETLLGNPMHRRFDSAPELAAAGMLLQETAPAERALYYHSTYSPEIRQNTTAEEAPMRILANPNTAHPEIQLLSNGRYHVMVTGAGSGSSRWKDISVTRWREDPTLDNWGSFCYMRDRETGEVWSNTHQPTKTPARSFEAVFSEGKAEFNRRDHEFDCHTEIVVSPEDDVEVRRLRITNHSNRPRVLDLTSFAEVALAGQAADDSHQAFSKLFVQTEIVRARQAVVCTRRPRTAEEKPPAMFHLLAVRGTEGGAVSYETDRLAFIGRGRDASCPAAVYGGAERLSDSEGAVLDPCVAIRTSVTLEAGDIAVIDLVTGVAEDRDALDALLEKYQDERVAERAFDLAWTHSQLLLRQLNATETDAQRYCQLAGSIVYANPALRAEPSVLARNRKGQSGLWGYSISGDLPVMLVKIEDSSRLRLVSQLLQAHTYWRQKGLKVDLVIWNEDQSGYRQSLHDQIVGLAEAAFEDSNMERPGGIFIRSADRISDEDRVLIQTVARVVMSDGEGMLDEQMRRQGRSDAASSTTTIQYRRPQPTAEPARSAPVEAGDLILANDYGGFSRDGTEYVIRVDGGRETPLPWVNVMANPDFGCVVSESGSSCTWAENAHEFRLTPWANDPVSDQCGEALYLRDEQTGDLWSPTPLPCRSGGQYVARHGFGYSVFEHNAYEVHSRLTIHVDSAASVKFLTLMVKNLSDRRRSLSATGYVEWVLGDIRAKTGMHVVTEVDAATGALFAGNRYNDEFRDRTAFLDVDDPGRTVTGDRREFLGRNGSMAKPFALLRANLSGRVGPGLDPCGAAQVKFALAPNQEGVVVFRLGVAPDAEAARRTIKAFRGPAAARASLERTAAFWKETVQAVQVETPDKAFDIMANGWLLYQTLSCRFWGRSATYQSGGAFGYRDQLQDSMALLFSRPDLVRRHLLECAARQFVEGDVMHWWHPPAGRGVRTRCSDDYLWLPFVTGKYLAVTGDSGVLDETVQFIKGRPVKDDEESYYDLPEKSEESASLYEHCRRALEHGLRFGAHGLPLMGTGDWNDGMDRVGWAGKGESVWLAFFLHATLTRFVEVARARSDGEFADRCLDEAKTLAANITTHAWDDEWYRRAYFDDGTPLGSAMNPECSIDSIAQSWAVISGVGDSGRAARGMGALYDHLVDREHKVVKLFEPPFDKSDLNPGYIKGYVPGVRENGGQYTHAAIWAAMGFAGLQDREKAWELFSIINPVNHALNKADADIYKVEPYVVAADVYAAPGHLGRGGWSWYTGSSSWLYRFMLESLLGFTLENGVAKLNPCMPPGWDGFSVRFRYKHSLYKIHVANADLPADVTSVNVNGVKNDGNVVEIVDDAKEHEVEVRLAARRFAKR